MVPVAKHQISDFVELSYYKIVSQVASFMSHRMLLGKQFSGFPEVAGANLVIRDKQVKLVCSVWISLQFEI